MNNFKSVIINKNRGWRGLAEAIVRDEGNDDVLKMVFSFSAAVWTDLIYYHVLVMQDKDNYYVIRFNDDDCKKLPRPEQQRSVLIKNWIGRIEEVNSYGKDTWLPANPKDWEMIKDFMKNRNNHTQSDWNCIGIRVLPSIQVGVPMLKTNV